MSSASVSPGRHGPHVIARARRTARRLEVRRLKRHFARVVAELEASETCGFTEPQRAARTCHMEELRRYALRGRFPQNADFTDPAPYFIDAEGTRCAMAHLIESAGGAGVAARIARTRNNAFIRELTSDTELLTWLAHAGLTVEEAAMIQPSYCSHYAAECFCNFYVTAVFEAVVESPYDGVGNATGTITAVHGNSAVQPGAPASFWAPFPLAVGDAVLFETDLRQLIFLVRPDGTVDTSTCQAPNFGSPPPSAPKAAVIANMLGDCGEGLGPEWTEPVGDCSYSASTGASASSASSSSAAAGSGGAGGSGSGAGGIAREADGESGGCSASSTGSGAVGGPLFVMSVLLAGIIRLRTRRVRK